MDVNGILGDALSGKNHSLSILNSSEMGGIHDTIIQCICKINFEWAISKQSYVHSDTISIILAGYHITSNVFFLDMLHFLFLATDQFQTDLELPGARTKT